MIRDRCLQLIRLPEIDNKLPQTEECCHNFWSLCKATERLGGCVAEFGVYKGASARILCDAKGERPIHLFDTFCGLPKTNPEIDTGHVEGDFNDTSFEEVSRLLEGQDGVHFHQGLFPDSASGLGSLRFSFVHLDVDIHKSALDGLRWFYPRLLSGGMILSHDYMWEGTPGVELAFDQFFRTMDVPVVRLHEIQCLVIKP